MKSMRMNCPSVMVLVKYAFRLLNMRKVWLTTNGSNLRGQQAFAAAGFASGATGPSRDMIVRTATPDGAAGRVYGFVYSGLDLGAAIGPVWFGFMLDHRQGNAIFLAAAACFVVAIATVMQVRRSRIAHAT